MGPRPIGRGNSSMLLHTSATPACASMGPRPIGRGNLAFFTQAYGEDTEASMGPRPIGRGNARGHVADSCSGSRGFNGAATYRSRKCAEQPHTVIAIQLASMGPRPIGRGNTMGEVPILLAGPLQWGRDRSVAEILEEAFRITREVELQWGRDRSVAEIQGPPDGGKLLLGPASMGPRPIGRGNRPPATRVGGRWCRLQWGRDRSVAEMNQAA